MACRPSAPFASIGAGRRGMGLWGVVLLLAVIGALGLMYYMNEQTRKDAEVKFYNEQLAPDDLINRVEIELTKRQLLADDSWERLLSLMTHEDQSWLKTNVALLAGYNPSSAGAKASALSPREQTFRALEFLLHLNQTAERHIVVRIAVSADDRYGAAYVHSPNNIHDLKEVFLLSEDGAWRIRHFMGKRDDPALLARIVQDKTAANLPLSEDEAAFKKDPKGFVQADRDKMLKQAGLGPDAPKP